MPDIWTWKTLVGEVLFFFKSENLLDVKISTDKEVYAPGDKVTYTLTFLNKTTGEVLTETDTYVNVVVTDESVFTMCRIAYFHLPLPLKFILNMR